MACVGLLGCVDETSEGVEHFVVRAKRKATLEVVLPLLESDEFFLSGPIAFACYRSYGFVVHTKAGMKLAERMREALEKIVDEDAWFALCGRYDARKRGIVGTNEGIPFRVLDRSDKELTDEEVRTQDVLYATCDVRNPTLVVQGSEPLATVAVATYGNALVLASSAWHGVFDGSGMMRFVGAWAAQCRGGERCPGSIKARERLARQKRSRETVKPPSLGEYATTWLVETAFASMNRSWLRASLGARKHHAGSVDLRPEIVAALKLAATPPNGAWVTTQEAVVARVLTVLWRLGGDLELPARNRIIFFMNGRRLLEANPDAAVDYVDDFGNFLHLHEVIVEKNLATASLAEVASDVHEGVSRTADAKTVRDFHLDVENDGGLLPRGFARLRPLMDDDGGYGFTLRFNNLAKLDLARWTDDAATVQICTMSGPNALVATPDGGLRLFLAHDTLKRTATLEDLQTALNKTPADL